MEVADPSDFGTSIFGAPRAVDLVAPSDPQRTTKVNRQSGAWWPHQRLIDFLPEGFSVPLECYTADDGLRRIVPQWNFEELIDLGAVGGLAVIHSLRGFDPQVDHSYRAMFLIHQHVRGRAYRNARGMKEHLTRNFNYSRDLFIRRRGRIGYDERDVLPNDLGEQRSPPSITALTRLGREAAREAGTRNPTSKHAINFGLFALARRNPLQVEPDQVANLVRMALFDKDLDRVDPSNEAVAIVTERLLAAIHAHLADPLPDFEQWFWASDNSVVKQIAQQKKAHGGKLDRETVRQVLLQLGWNAYSYAGQCVHALMRTVKNSLSPSLNEDEKRLFEHMYESQPYYGGFPAALLAERMDFLQQAVLAIWQEPQNAEHVGVLHRLLACYAEMAAMRRAADRRSKTSLRRPGHGKATHARPAAVAMKWNLPRRDRTAPTRHKVGLDEEVSIERQKLPPFQQVAARIRELRGITCSSGCLDWDCSVEEGATEESVTITMRCGCGRCRQQIELTPEEFAEEAEKELGWLRLTPAEDGAEHRAS
jgi:hypothetical protein